MPNNRPLTMDDMIRANNRLAKGEIVNTEPVTFWDEKTNQYRSTSDYGVNSAILQENARKLDPANMFVADEEEYLRYRDYDVTLKRYHTQEELDRERAENQGAMEQLGHALMQAGLNEVVLGIVKAFPDIIDRVANIWSETGTDDYTNPVSQYLEEIQDKIRDRFAVYQENPNKGFAPGDFGWWMQGLINSASTLSLLIPGMAFAKGASLIGRIGAIGSGLNRVSGISRGISKMMKAAKLTKTPAALARKIDAGARIGTSALVSRIAENAMEGREVYKEVYSSKLQELNNMSQEEMAEFLSRNPQFEGKSNNEIAQYLASVSADKTYNADFAMLLMDIPQFKALSALTRGLRSKGVTNRLRNILNRELGALGKSAATEATEEAAEAASKGFLSFLRGGAGKAWNTIKNTVGVSWTEGIEEGYQAIMIEKGKEVAEKYINPNFRARTLGDYFTDDQIWSQAFWGVMGGMLFQLGGKGLSKIQRQMYISKNKDKLTQQEIDMLDMSEEKRRGEQIKGYRAGFQNLVEKLQSINEGINPFVEQRNENGEVVKNENGEIQYETIDSEEKRNILKDQVITDFLTDLTLNSADVGNYDIFRAFVTDPRLKKYFQENKVDADWTNTAIRHMDEVYENYNQALNDFYEARDGIDNEFVTKRAARYVARNKLRLGQIREHIDDIMTAIEQDSDASTLTNEYMDKRQLDYAQVRLNKLGEALSELEAQYALGVIDEITYNVKEKEINRLRKTVLDSVSKLTPFGENEEIKSALENLSDESEEKDFMDFISKFNSFREDLTKETVRPKKELDKLAVDYAIYKTEEAELESMIPNTDERFREIYKVFEDQFDLSVKKKYDEYVSKLTEYIEKAEDPDQAISDLLNGNVSPDLKEAMTAFKLASKSTDEFLNRFMVTVNQIKADKYKKEQAENTVTQNGEELSQEEAQSIKDQMAEPEETDTAVPPSGEEQSDDTSSTGEQERATDATDTTETVTPSTGSAQVESSTPTATPSTPANPANTDSTPTSSTGEENLPTDSTDTVSPPREGMHYDPVIGEYDDSIFDEPETYSPYADEQIEVVGSAIEILKELMKNNSNTLNAINSADETDANFKKIVDELKQRIRQQGFKDQAIVNHGALTALKVYFTYKAIQEQQQTSKESKFQKLAADIAVGGRTHIDENGKLAITEAIEGNDPIIEEFLAAYIENKNSKKGIVGNELEALTGSKIDVVDLFTELLNSTENYEYIKRIFQNLVPYILNKKNQVRFSNVRVAQIYAKDPSGFINELILRKSAMAENINPEEMHIAKPTKPVENYDKVVRELKTGDEVVIRWRKGTKSISISRNGVEIGYLGTIQKSADNNRLSLGRGVKGFNFSVWQQDGGYATDLDWFFDALLDENNEQSKIVLDYLRRYGNEDLSEKELADLWKFVLKSYAPLQELLKTERNADGEVIKAPGFRLAVDYRNQSDAANAARTEMLFSRLYNILIGYREDLSPRLNYDSWKESMYINYSHTLAIQEEVKEGGVTKGNIVVRGKKIIQFSSKPRNIKNLGLSANTHKLVATNQTGQIVAENTDEIFENRSQMIGRMGFLLNEDKNNPLIAWFSGSAKINTRNAIGKALQSEIKNILLDYLPSAENALNLEMNGTHNWEAQFRKLTIALNSLFNNYGKYKSLFRGFNVVEGNGFVGLALNKTKGNVDTNFQNIMLGINMPRNGKQGSIVFSKNGIKETNEYYKSKNQLTDKVLNKITKAIINELTFHESFITLDSKGLENQYVKVENGKMSVTLGGKTTTYNGFGDFAIKNGAFYTKVEGDAKTGFLKESGDPILYLSAKKLSAPESSEQTEKTKQSPTELIKEGSKTSPLLTENILEIAGFSEDYINALLGKNGYEIQLLPTEFYYDKNAGKGVQAYYSNGKIYVGNAGISQRNYRKENLVRLLIHESIHGKASETGIFNTNPEIVNDLLETHRLFIEYLEAHKAEEGVKNIYDWAVNNHFLSIEDYTANLTQKQLKSITSGIPSAQLFAEEWLAESLSQVPIAKLLNQIAYDNANVSNITNERKTLWQKIIDLLCKIFGIHVNDNTLLARQYEILGNQGEITNAQKEEIRESNEESTTPKIDTNTENTEQSESEIPRRENTPPIRQRRNREGGKKFAVSDNINDDFESLFDENPTINSTGIQSAPNMETYLNQFPPDIRDNVKYLIETNQLRWYCR